MKRWSYKFFHDNRGMVAPVAALGIIAFVGLTSMAIDMGHLYSVRNQLQNTADATALAAVAKLISQQGGEVVRDVNAAQTAAYTVARSQALNDGLPDVPGASRTDLSITYGVWDPKKPNDQAWSGRGSTVPGNSDANAVQITIRRAEGVTYGPVTNFFSSILSSDHQTSDVQATAIAYMGYTSSVQTGMVTAPIALPSSLISVAESKEGGNWLFRMFQPKEAIATSYVEAQFKDLGSNTFYQTNYAKPQLDTAKAYMFVVNNNDSVPGTVIDNLNFAKNNTTGKAIRPMNRGTRLYPLSEYQWVSNIDSIFLAFKNAYNAKKDAQGNWQVAVPVYTTTQPTAQDFRSKIFRLARIFSLGPSEAHACFTFWNQSYPGGNVPLYVEKFATVNITNVVTASTRTSTIPAPAGKCNDCTSSSIYNAKVNNNYIYAGSSTDQRIADCMMKNTTDCRNTNYVTVQIPQGSSTTGLPVVRGGSSSVGSVASADSGAFSGRAVLVK